MDVPYVSFPMKNTARAICASSGSLFEASTNVPLLFDKSFVCCFIIWLRNLLLQAAIFASLGGTAHISKNFKVRISAATAMAAAKHRSLYGSADTYLVVWQSLADVLESLEDIEADFAEYKYRNSLEEQVKCWLCGMTDVENWSIIQGDHLSGIPGKSGNVGEICSCQGNVRDFTKNQGNVGEEILLGKSCLKLFIVNYIFASIQVFSTSMSMI